MKALRTAVWLLDEGLDRIPARYYDDETRQRRWIRHGHWGCLLHMSRFWGKGEVYFGACKAMSKNDFWC